MHFGSIRKSLAPHPHIKGCRVCRLITFKQVNDADNPRISIDTFRKITKDYTSTTEEIEEIINNLYILSELVYTLNNN